MIGALLGGFAGGILLTAGLYYWIIGRHRNRKKIPSLTKYVIFSVVVILGYTIAEFITASITGTSHDTLTTCFYACFGGEILSCALIKIFKLKRE